MWSPRLCREHSFEVCGLDTNGPIGSCIRTLSYREWNDWFTLGRIDYKHERDLELLHLCCINIQNLKCTKVCSFKNTIIGKKICTFKLLPDMSELNKLKCKITFSLHILKKFAHFDFMSLLFDFHFTYEFGNTVLIFLDIKIYSFSM